VPYTVFAGGVVGAWRVESIEPVDWSVSADGLAVGRSWRGRPRRAGRGLGEPARMPLRLRNSYPDTARPPSGNTWTEKSTSASRVNTPFSSERSISDMMINLGWGVLNDCK
jgi:hypothetical protein